MPILTPPKPKLADTFGRLVDREGKDLGLLVSDALDYARLSTQFERQAEAQKEDAHIQLIGSEQLMQILQHAPEAIGHDWYVLPDVFRAYDKEGGFGFRIVKGLPLATAKRIADDGLAANKSSKEFFAFPEDYGGLVDALQCAKRYNAPDGTLKFGRKDDPALSRFAQYKPVKDCFGDGAKHLAAHIANLKNDGYFGTPSHKYLASAFKSESEKVMLRPLFIVPDGIDWFYDFDFSIVVGRSRLVVPVARKKLHRKNR